MLSAAGGRSLAAYKAPKTYEFVLDFPRSDAGKIQRSAMVAERTIEVRPPAHCGCRLTASQALEALPPDSIAERNIVGTGVRIETSWRPTPCDFSCWLWHVPACTPVGKRGTLGKPRDRCSHTPGSNLRRHRAGAHARDRPVLGWNPAGELRIQRCNACGRYYFYPRPFCSYCASRGRGVATVSGRGRLVSYIINYRPLPPAAPDRPQIIALVELEEGPRLLTNLVGAAPEPGTCRSTLPVHVEFEPRGDQAIPVFPPGGAR